MSKYYIPEYKIQLVKDSNKGGEGKHPVKVTCPQDIVAPLIEFFSGADREIFVVVLLDTKNTCIGRNTVSIGTLNASIVHPREVFKPAVLGNANSIILAHNHPSGDATPSKEDIDITDKLKQAGDVMKIQVIDHIIIGDGDNANSYYSFKEEGII